MEPGEIRGPIKTQFGYHVIKLISKNPRALADVRRGAAADHGRARRDARRRPRPSGAAATLGGPDQALSNTSDDELRKLQDDAVTYNTSEWISKGEPITGIGANAAAPSRRRGT